MKAWKEQRFSQGLEARKRLSPWSVRDQGKLKEREFSQLSWVPGPSPLLPAWRCCCCWPQLFSPSFPAAPAARPRFRREESPGLLSRVQNHIFSYWQTAKAKAQELYENVHIPRVDQNLRHVYDKGTEAMTTYTGILTDQIIHMLKGEQ
ncbi:apolipoprotein C-II isoform X2 [Antechinus flavipes]|uniref:apolipoprotein C-II isoform X2 n=1 Tax=Antechinus flavipes TaxID=38775 RepID=UPI002236AB20|nr:apolipoprotein C-II isoform X2 [Antechinus flavipes]